ncbi:transcriptional regulator [Thiocystis minor]|uniref:transcriptional regulator n=1 Tax=Thiocystis minor TaxID=61597 RepID=UPI00191154D2|nr:YdaS family helix-turn-helix protein [Thiocystis minor]
MDATNIASFSEKATLFIVANKQSILYSRRMKLFLEQAIASAGSQVALARQIGASQQMVSQWLTQRNGRVSPVYCRRIEEATGVSRYDLRPDIFGPPPAANRTKPVRARKSATTPRLKTTVPHGG